MNLTLKRIYVDLFYQEQFRLSTCQSELLLIDPHLQDRIRTLLDTFILECGEQVGIPEDYYLLYHREFGNLPLLLKIIHQLDGPSRNFTPPYDQEFEWLSAEYLLHFLEDYLNRKLRPLQVCLMIQRVEMTIMGAPRSLPEKFSYYPIWLGDLWNQCDWCDESWQFETAEHLAKAIESQVIEISKWLKDHIQLVDTGCKI